MANLAALLSVTLQWLCRDSKRSLFLLVHLDSMAAENEVQENVQRRLISMQTRILRASFGSSKRCVKLNISSANRIFSTTSACSGRSWRMVLRRPTMLRLMRSVLVPVIKEIVLLFNDTELSFSRSLKSTRF